MYFAENKEIAILLSFKNLYFAEENTWKFALSLVKSLRYI